MNAARRRLTLPLTAWVTGGVAFTILVVLFAVWFVLMRGGLQRDEQAALGVGAVVGLIATVAALRWSHRVTAELQAL
ncbi:MAG TPA: hypothetical protein VEK80_09410, partial [Kribbellaceae bacterium]|nr:hypothetical protein [Kribbellaceae bacterium]